MTPRPSLFPVPPKCGPHWVVFETLRCVVDPYAPVCKAAHRVAEDVFGAVVPGGGVTSSRTLPANGADASWASDPAAIAGCAILRVVPRSPS